MIHKITFSTLSALLTWILGVSFYLVSFYIPFLEDTELQSNLFLAFGILPSAGIGTYFFYKKSYINPSILALTFVLVAALLDALITVPVFIFPTGGSHATFFGDPMFYSIAVELYFVVLYVGTYLTKKIKA